MVKFLCIFNHPTIVLILNPPPPLKGKARNRSRLNTKASCNMLPVYKFFYLCFIPQFFFFLPPRCYHLVFASRLVFFFILRSASSLHYTIFYTRTHKQTCFLLQYFENCAVMHDLTVFVVFFGKIKSLRKKGCFVCFALFCFSFFVCFWFFLLKKLFSGFVFCCRQYNV